MSSLWRSTGAGRSDPGGPRAGCRTRTTLRPEARRVHPYRDDEVLPGAEALARRRRLAQRRMRCLRAAKLSFIGGAAGLVFLCAQGMRPAAVAVPVMLVVLSLSFAAGSAALFAYVARLHLEIPDHDADDDGGGPGGGAPDDPPEPSGGGDFAFDWEQFEREFRSHCERVPAAR